MTWTPVAGPSQAWTVEPIPVRVFDPYVFDRAPIFDTGSSAGVWSKESQPSAAWTAE